MRKISGKFIRLLMLILAALFVLLPVTYAVTVSDYDAVIRITDETKADSKSFAFHPVAGSAGSDNLVPGEALQSIVHLTNGNYFKKITLQNLGVWPDNLTATELQSFADNISLTIRKGKNKVFSTTLYEGPLSGILFEPGSALHTGHNIDLVLNSFGTADLEYTLAMSENAGAELQGLTAQLKFYFTLNKVKKSDNSRGETGDKLQEIPAPPFLIEPVEWYDDCITALIRYGIIIPAIDGEVRSNDFITRGEAAVLLGRALGLPEDRDTPPPYLDSIPERFKGYVNATTQAGIFRGYPLLIEALPGRVFKSDAHITREELFCVMVRAYKTPLIGDLELVFTDKDKISGWALQDIKAGVQNKIAAGYPDNTFRPQQFMSQAEAFCLICRLQGYHAGHGAESGGDGNG
jgi:hypothetical protein